VIRADSPAAARSAAERIRAILESAGEPAGSQLLVERFVPGPEVAVEGIMRAGAPEIITVFDKPDPLDGPFFEETFYLSPSLLSPPLLEAVRRASGEAVRALGLTDGPFHAELRVPGALQAGATGGGGSVKVLEVAARTIGGRCAKAMRLEDGSSLEELVIANALGVEYPPPGLASACGILMIPIPASGVLQSVDGIEAARAVPGITGIEITIPLGRPVRTLPEGDRYLGFVFASGDTRAVVETALRQAECRLEVHVGAAADGGGTLSAESADPVVAVGDRDTLA
jgi:hypothetical protein